MAVPKRRTSKAVKRSRKAQWTRKTAPGVCKCPQCQEAMRPHRVCPHCGFYKGREVIKHD